MEAASLPHNGAMPLLPLPVLRSHWTRAGASSLAPYIPLPTLQVRPAVTAPGAAGD